MGREETRTTVHKETKGRSDQGIKKHGENGDQETQATDKEECEKLDAE